MANLKIYIIVAVAGFVISFLAGITHTVQLHIVFLRAFFSAVLFFGLAFAANLLLKSKLNLVSANDTSDETSLHDEDESTTLDEPESSLSGDIVSNSFETTLADVPSPSVATNPFKEITADKITTDNEIDFRQQDPELLAKAIRTVLKEE